MEQEHHPDLQNKKMLTKERFLAVGKEMSLALSKLENFNVSYQDLLRTNNYVDGSHYDFRLKNRNKSSEIEIIKSHVADFFNNMSLPGMKYMGESGRNDRYLWVFILILSILVTSKYIEDAYKKWQDSPILLSFNDSLSHISQIVFPAVTLCPPTQISLDYNLTDSIQRCHMDQDCNTSEWSRLQAASLLCPNAFSKFFSYYFRNPYMNDNITAYIRQVSSHCKDHFRNVTFPDTGQAPCNHLLQTVFIEEKVCFTFNLLGTKDLFIDGVIPPMIDDTTAPPKPYWTPDLMLPLADLHDTVPRYVDSIGERDQLVFTFQNHTDTHRTSCQHSYSKTEIALHSPAEMPTRQAHKFKEISLDENVVIEITPDIVVADNQLFKYTPDKRGCFFEHEVKLALFRVYTQRNCQTECYINCTLNVCGCVPFYMPRLNENVTLCTSLMDRKCIQIKLQGLMRNLWLNSLRPSQKIYKEKMKLFYPNCVCNCPRDCTLLYYYPSVEEETEEDHDSMEHSSVPPKTLKIIYADYLFGTLVRKELIGLTDFIANSGGVLGVFTGFSFVALIEMFYYLTLRLWVTIRHAWDRYDEELEEELSYSLNTE